MIDFTSALYLGLSHASADLPAWDSLTTGRPAAMGVPPASREVGASLARLIGTERASLAPSTFHLFWDLFGQLSRGPICVHYDDAVYPIVEWGLERARGVGVHTVSFPHHDADWLQWQLKRFAGPERPIVVTDGYCPGCGRRAPLRSYLEILRARGGLLVIDDTQSIGVFGPAPSFDAPFGRGGGGSLRAEGLSGPDVVVGASLAKAFGVPVAVLAGSEAHVSDWERSGDTRVHCSPPSAAVIAAARHALSCNESDGEELRRRLARRIRDFQARCPASPAGRTHFPVQRVRAPARAAQALWQRLRSRGVATVLERSACDREGLSVSFVLTARHGVREVDAGVAALHAALAGAEPQPLLARKARDEGEVSHEWITDV